MQNFISITIITPEEEIYVGNAGSIILPAIDGYMEFKFNHAPLVTALGHGTLELIELEGRRKFFYVNRGFAEIHDNQLIILADHVERGEEIDTERAKAARVRATKRMLDQDSGKWDIDRVKEALDRAGNRLETYGHIEKGQDDN